jgi:hypothetical protein
VSKRCLVVYTSLTGNTQKVAERFKSTFEKHGWDCDLVKIRKRAGDILNPPFDLEDYDFVCVGTGIRLHLPYNEILNVMRRLQLGEDPRFTLRTRDETIPYITDPLPATPPPGGPERQYARHQRIVLAPDSPVAVVFATYGGYEFGPKEAEPSLQLLALEIEHLGFRCIGHFCCPGKFLNDPTPRTYHGDIRNRPNETDLLKAELFIEDRLEEIAEHPA